MPTVDPVGVVVPAGPVAPAQEPVDGVVLVRLGERDLVVLAAEGVGPVTDPFGPRNQRLPPRTGATILGPIPVEQLDPADAVLTQPTADLDDGGALVAVAELGRPSRSRI
jgi:hypothetical protein